MFVRSGDFSSPADIVGATSWMREYEPTNGVQLNDPLQVMCVQMRPSARGEWTYPSLPPLPERPLTSTTNACEIMLHRASAREFNEPKPCQSVWGRDLIGRLWSAINCDIRGFEKCIGGLFYNPMVGIGLFKHFPGKPHMN